MQKPSRKLRFRTLEGLLRNLRQVAIYRSSEDREALLPMLYVQGRGKLLLVLGDNATGKSLVRRSLSALCKDAGIESMPVSMHGRTSSCFAGFIYGDEGYQSTGEISAKIVLKGISTCRAREKPHIIIWDEPDLGMSDEFARAAGIEIARFAQDPPEHTVAIVVSSHSHSLLQQFLPLNPHYICMGKDPPATIGAWLSSRTSEPRLLQELIDSSMKNQKRLFALEKKIRDAEKKG